MYRPTLRLRGQKYLGSAPTEIWHRPTSVNRWFVFPKLRANFTVMIGACMLQRSDRDLAYLSNLNICGLLYGIPHLPIRAISGTRVNPLRTLLSKMSAWLVHRVIRVAPEGRKTPNFTEISHSTFHGAYACACIATSHNRDSTETTVSKSDISLTILTVLCSAEHILSNLKSFYFSTVRGAHPRASIDVLFLTVRPGTAYAGT